MRRPEAETGLLSKRFTVSLPLTPGNYLFGFVLGHGGEATVEAPEAVAEATRWSRRAGGPYA